MARLCSPEAVYLAGMALTPRLVERSSKSGTTWITRRTREIGTVVTDQSPSSGAGTAHLSLVNSRYASGHLSSASTVSMLHTTATSSSL